MNLKDLPENTIPDYIQESIVNHALEELKTYATARMNDVARGAETAPFAAMLFDKFAAGMAKAFEIAGIDTQRLAHADTLAREIDPHFNENRQARWEARPAGLKNGEEEW
jgi:hypothetical protein